MKKHFLYLIFCVLGLAASAQQNIDKTIAVIGKYIVLRSDLEREFKGMRADGIKITDSIRCAIMDELMYQKLLIAQAEKD
ncbi:MAG: peptidylprolyl isomerase, partial [Bacteroidia bacterium]